MGGITVGGKTAMILADYALMDTFIVMSTEALEPEPNVIELQYVETPDIPFISGEDRPAWESSYGPPGNKRKSRR